MKKLLAVLRVPGGIVLAILVALLLCVPAFARIGVMVEEAPVTVTHVLPFANAAPFPEWGKGYETIRVVLNPTDHAIDIARPCRDGQSSCPPIVDRLEPGQVQRIHDWPGMGTNIAPVTLDHDLVAYSEFVTPRGTICRIPPLGLVQRAEYYDLTVSEGFEAYVFVAVPAGESGWFVLNGKTYQIDDTSAQLVPLDTDRATLTLGYDKVYPNLPGPSAVYTFAIVVHDLTGAITVQEPIE